MSATASCGRGRKAEVPDRTRTVGPRLHRDDLSGEFRLQRPDFRIIRRAIHAGLLLCVFGRPGGVRAQRPGLEVRAGVIASSALARDNVANPALIERLGAAFDGPVRAQASIGPIVQVSVLLPLRARTTLDMAAGWTFSGLDAVDAAGRRDIQNFSTAQVTIGVRYALATRADAGCGFGALRYFATGGLFEGGARLAPLVECSTGSRIGPARHALALRVIAQAHRFRTPILRDAGAHTGTVFRLSIQAGIALPHRR